MKHPVRHQQGASLIEFIVVIPVLGMLVAGIFELTMMYRARAVLDAATFEAAQQGALNNARLDTMRTGLAQGMMPHLLRGRSPTAVAAAYARAEAFVRLGGGGVSIVSPTRAIFQAFAQRQTVHTSLDAEGQERPRRVIPNDNLMWRSSQTRLINVGGDRVPVNVQDANLLKVQTYWCHRLLTPAFDRIIWEMVVSAETIRRCGPASAATGGYYVLLTSSSVTRMHSPVIDQDLPN